MFAERWINCSEFPGYEVSSLGKVRKKDTKKVAAPMFSSGRWCVRFYVDGREKRVGVGQVVFRSFYPNQASEKRKTIFYRNGNKADLRPENLYVKPDYVRKKPRFKPGPMAIAPKMVNRVPEYNAEALKRWKSVCPICPGNVPLKYCWGDVDAPESSVPVR